MMHIFLFIIYSLALGFGVLRIPFFRNSGIRPGWLLLFFALHIAAGCAHTFIAYHYYPDHGDVWFFFQRSFLTRHRLTSEFNLFLYENSTWNYATHNGIILVNILLNYLSFDNLYINTLLFSFPVFLGNIALFRVFRRQFPGDPLTAISALVLPSTLFWTSCLHREGAVYSLLGLLFYYGDRFFSRRWDIRTGLYCLLLFGGIVYFRPAVALSLLPALLVWSVLSSQSLTPSQRPEPMERPGMLSPRSGVPRPAIVLAATALTLLLLFFVIPGPASALLRSLSARQQEFQILEGGSRIYLPSLQNNWSSVLRVFPWALRNGLFEPLPGSGGQSVYIAFSLELIVIWGIIIGALFRRIIGRRPPFSPFAWTCLVYSLPGMFLVGMIVPFAGAIVRYRSIYLPFLLAPFLHSWYLSGSIRRLNKSLSIYIFSEPLEEPGSSHI